MLERSFTEGMGRNLVVIAFGLVAACSTTAGVPCTLDDECRRYAALCVEGTCRVPEGVDLAGVDFSAPTDLAESAPSDLAIDSDQGFACTKAADCPDGLPICGADHVCRSCTTGDNAGCVEHDVHTPRCEVSTGVCMGCRNAGQTDPTDCTNPSFPICSVDHSCRGPCAADDNCPSGVCAPIDTLAQVRSCVRSEEVAYVQGAAGCTGTHAGTMADPLCSLDAALTARPNGGFIDVLLGTKLGPTTQPIDKTYVITGNGQISGPNTGPLNLTHTGFNVVAGGTLYLRNIDIADTENAAIRCSGGKVTMAESELQRTKPAAIVSTNCDLTIDRIRISASQDGIRHDGGHLTLTNSFIQDNAGVALSTTANSTTDRAAYLTIVNNVPAVAGVGGALSCGGTISVINSIIVLNQQTAAGVSHTGACNFAYSDVVPTVAGAAMHSVLPNFFPPLVTPRSYALDGATMNNLSCCINQGQPLGGNWYDFAGTFRSAQTPDIGAAEFP